jgi:hypothetical protein
MSEGSKTAKPVIKVVAIAAMREWLPDKVGPVKSPIIPSTSKYY